MGSSTRKFPSVAGQIDAARTQVARLRQRLLHPAAGALEDALPDLERAIWLLRESEGLGHRDGESEDWKRALDLQKELTQVKALARQANEFYAMKIRLLAQNDSPVDYNCNGVAFQEPSGQTPFETALQKGLIVHG
jgi:hypothetical protein